MSDPWKTEADKHSPQQQYSDIRELKFKDNHTHKVRLLPDKGSSRPFHGYTIHWIPQQNSKKGRPIVHAIDKKCVVCEYISDIWTEINRLKEEEDLTDNSPEIKKLHKKQQDVRGQKKYDFNALDRENMKHEVNGKKDVVAPVRMSAPSTVWKPVFDYAKNEKWGSPSNEETGYDFEISTEGEGTRRQYSVAPDRDASPLSKEEKAAIKLGYALEKLRKSTSSKDIREILENAKAPYSEEIMSLFSSRESDDSDDDEPTSESESTVEETTESETNEVEEPEEKEESEEKTPAKTEEVEEPEEETEKTEENTGADANDLNNYECKGEYEEDEDVCKTCPVKSDCQEFLPVYQKAQELEIDTSAKRTIKEITADVKKATKKEEKEELEKKPKGKLGKGKKQLPF